MKKILFTIFTLLMCKVLFIVADPAPRTLFLYSQPDGSSIRIRECGDEYFHWEESEDGSVITTNAQGVMEYAEIINGQIKASGIKVNNVEEKTPIEITFARIQAPKLNSFINISALDARRKASSPSRLNAPTSPVIGMRKILTVLVGFSDYPFTYSVLNFDSLMNRPNYTGYGNAGSVQDFYSENSYDQLTMESTVIGICPALHDTAYYKRPQGGSSNRSRELVREAIEYAKTRGVDFSSFDGDDDGKVDCIHIVYAGNRYQVGGPGFIWPYHSTYDTTFTQDGHSITISDYIMTPEKLDIDDNSMNSIGTICHELGHVLGAPDFYPVGISNDSQKSHLGTGFWDIMGEGNNNDLGYTPSHHNPYTKTAIFQWATPNTINASEKNSIYNIPASSQCSTAIYKIPTSTTGEYYLIENRQKVSFDRYLPDSGLHIYHIHSNIENTITSNTVNSSLPQMCYLVNPRSNQAIPTDTLSYGETYSNVFPSSKTLLDTTTNIFFSSQTNPRSQSWAGDPTGVDVCFIQHNGNNIKFVVNPQIEGAPYLCDTMYHYLRNVPTGASIQWQLINPSNSYYSYVIQGSSTADSVLVVYHVPFAKSEPDAVTPPFPPVPTDSAMTLKATVSSGGSSYVVEKKLYLPSVGIPAISASDTTTHWTRNTQRTFTITNCNEVSDGELNWVITRTRKVGSLFPPQTVTVFQGTGRSITYTPTGVGTYEVIATNNGKPCDTNTASKTYIVSNTIANTNAGGEDDEASFTDEQNKDALSQIKQRIIDNNATYTLELWHTMYGRMSVQEVRNTNEQISTTGLPRGVYVVLLKENGKTIAQTKVIIQ